MSASDWSRIRSIKFIRLVDGVRVPVGPVHQVLEHGQAEGVLEQGRGVQDNLPVHTFIYYKTIYSNQNFDVKASKD